MNHRSTFSQDERILASMWIDGVIRLWDISNFVDIRQAYLDNHLTERLPDLERQLGYKLDGLELRPYEYPANMTPEWSIHHPTTGCPIRNGPTTLIRRTSPRQGTKS